MVLVDSSVWIDHIRFPEAEMERLLLADKVVCHPMVSGELALGSIKSRTKVLEEIDWLPQAIVATDEEVRRFIETHKLFGRGVGYIDAHLLVAVQLTPETLLWTRDKRLHEVAAELGLVFGERGRSKRAMLGVKAC